MSSLSFALSVDATSKQAQAFKIDADYEINFRGGGVEGEFSELWQE